MNHDKHTNSDDIDLEAGATAGKKQEEPPWKPRKEEFMIMITLTISSLIVALDATILVPVLPTLALDLNGSASLTFWTGTSYLLTHAVVQPYIASLSDIFGRREALLPSISLFLIGSIVCGVAHNFTAMIAGRVVQGVGGGGIIALAQIVFADIVPLRQRPKFFAMVLIAWAIGTVLGPAIGGAFAQKASWRWCFYLNIPICVVALGMTLFYVRLSTARTSLKSKLARVDWIGGFLFIFSLTSFLIAISWGGVQFNWGSWHTLVPLILGAAGVLGSLVWERFGAKEPFLAKKLFDNRSAIAAYICASMQGLVLFMALYYIPFYFSSLRNASPVRSGINLFPGTFLVLPGSAVVSQLITRTGHYRWAIWSGWAISLLGSGLFILIDATTRTAVWATAFAIWGLGMGMALSSINFGIQAIVDPPVAGKAAAMYSFVRSLGMTVGVAVGGSVFQNVMKHSLVNKGLSSDIAHDAEAFIPKLHAMPDGLQKAGIVDAYVDGFKGVWITMTAISALAFVVGLTIRSYSMDKILETNFKIRRGSTSQSTS